MSNKSIMGQIKDSIKNEIKKDMPATSSLAKQIKDIVNNNNKK